MIRFVVTAALAGAGCLASPPPSGSSTEADIYSKYEYERSGTLRFEKLALEEAGVAAVSIWHDVQGAARILLDDTSTNVYAPGDLQMEMPRDFGDEFFSIGFANDEIVFRASHDGSDWRTLVSWPDEFTEPVRLGLAASTPAGTVELSLGGLNTAVDCQ